MRKTKREGRREAQGWADSLTGPKINILAGYASLLTVLVRSISGHHIRTVYITMVAEPTNAGEGTLYEILNVPTSASSKEVRSYAPVTKLLYPLY